MKTNPRTQIGLLPAIRPSTLPVNRDSPPLPGAGSSDDREGGGPRLTARCVLWGMFVLLLLHGHSLNAQQSLRSMFEKGGVEWIAGKWMGTNQQGREVTVGYEWGLNGHVLELDLKIGDMDYQGMIVHRPSDGQLIEFGANSLGGMTRSTWHMDQGTLVTKRTGTRADGREARVAVVTKKVDDDTVIATVHGLTGDGTVGDEVLETVKLSRQASPQDDK